MKAASALRGVGLLAVLAVAGFAGFALGINADGLAAARGERAIMLLTPLALVASAAYVCWHADPAWTMSAAVALSIFNGNWEALRVSGVLAPDRLLLAAAIGAMLVHAAVDPSRPRPRIRFVHWLLAGVAAYAVCSALATGSLSDHAAQFRLLDRLGVVPFAVFFAAPVIFATPRQRDILLGTLVALGAYLGVTALFETLRVDALVWPKYILNPDYGLHFGRARGPFADANANGLMLFACGGAAVYATARWRAPLARVAAGGVVLLCILGILFCLSRSVWLGASAGTFIVLIAARQLRRHVVPAIGGLALIIAVALAVVPGLSQQATERKNNQLTVWDRKNLNRAALAMVEDKPLFGVGWGRFTQESPRYIWQAESYPIVTATAGLPVHNVFLSNAAEMGLVGASLWLMALALAVGGALLGRPPPALRAWRMLLLAYAGAWLVVANFSPLVGVLTNMTLWLLAGVVLVARPPLGADVSNRGRSTMLKESDSKAVDIHAHPVERPAGARSRRRPAGRRARTRRALAGVLIALPVATILGLGVLAATSDFMTYGPVGNARAWFAPEWTDACRELDLETRRLTVLHCGRIKGWVLYVQREDPDGDGDAHVLVVAGAHLVSVKWPLGRAPQQLPSPGTRFEAAGHIVAGRFGIPEIVIP